MPHAYVSQLMHCVFATKDREPWIVSGFRERLYAYVRGIASAHRVSVLAIGGVEDHIHILVSLPSTISLSKAMQLIKGGSAHWVHETFHDKLYFAWQEGYGAFSIGASQMERTKAYIDKQIEHHRTVGYQEELRRILTKHGLLPPHAQT